MKKNISLLSLFGVLFISMMISGCKGCTKSEQEAWDKFIKHANECAAKRDAFLADCKKTKEADAWAELQACKTACPFNIGACGINPTCITEAINERLRCILACEETYRQKIISNEECEAKWNEEFMNCLQNKPR